MGFRGVGWIPNWGILQGHGFVCFLALMRFIWAESSLPRMPLYPACSPGRQQHPAGRDFPAAWELLEGEGFPAPGMSWGPAGVQSRDAAGTQGPFPRTAVHLEGMGGWGPSCPHLPGAEGQPHSPHHHHSDISISFPHWSADRSE